jgi:hypothetical protein
MSSIPEPRELEVFGGCSADHRTALNADLSGGAGVFMNWEAIGAVGELVVLNTRICTSTE